MLPGSVRQPARATPVTAQLELEQLESLPCGCVVSVQRARHSMVRYVSIEAKGPHCSFASHRTDRVLRIGDPSAWHAPDDSDDETTGP